jgi:hypothetical protein
VHHFKWRAGVCEYLSQRARGFEGSTRPGEMRVHNESLSAVKLLSRGVALEGDGLAAFPASLKELPANWDEIAAPIWRYWQVDRWRMRARRRRLRAPVAAVRRVRRQRWTGRDARA